MDTSTDQYDDALYDATEPLACTINAAEVPDHIALIERIRTNMVSIERTRHGVLIHLPRNEANVADARQFATEEKQCCEFWGFDVIEQPALALRWDGPPETAEFMDRLIGYFEGREPIGTLFGFL